MNVKGKPHDICAPSKTNPKANRDLSNNTSRISDILISTRFPPVCCDDCCGCCCPSSSFLGNKAINIRLLINPDPPLSNKLCLHPTTSARITHPNNPIMPPIEWAEFSNPTASPSDPLPKYLVIKVTLGPKNNAIPRPTTNRSISICCNCEDRPQRSAAD